MYRPLQGVAGAKEARAREAWQHSNLRMALELMPSGALDGPPKSPKMGAPPPPKTLWLCGAGGAGLKLERMLLKELMVVGVAVGETDILMTPPFYPY